MSVALCLPLPSTLIQGLKDIAHVELNERVEGNIRIKWQRLNDTGKALIDIWFLGMCGIAAGYHSVGHVALCCIASLRPVRLLRGI